MFKNGGLKTIGPGDGIVGNVNSIGPFLSSSYFYYGTPIH